jgi:ABC-2 type transport system permease protein
MMIQLIRLEIYKLYTKGRSWIALSALLFIIVVVLIAMYSEGEELMAMGTQSLQDSFMFEGNVINGYLITYLIQNAMLVHVPLLLALVCGDLISGEASTGTIRFLLTRKVSRNQIIISKFITALFYSTVMVTLMMVLSLGLGVLIFGKGDMIILKDVVYIIDEKTVPMRMFYAYLFSILGMATVASLAFMFSAFTQSNVTPIVMTMVVIVAFTILSALNIEFFNLLKKFFFTNYMNNWKLFFEDPFNKEKIIRSVVILLSHIALFFSITLYYFNKKDIQS